MATSFNNKAARILLYSTHLKACKSIKFKFNPWRDDAKSVRLLFKFLNKQDCRSTNPKCSMFTDIRSDNIEPEMEVTFVDDTRAKFKTTALTAHDIVKEFNRLTSIKTPKEESSDN